MILGELLSRPVVQDDVKVGVVVDVRLRLADDGADPEVVGLVVGPRDGIAFLGFERRRVRHPAVIARFFAWRQRGSFLVDVSDVRLTQDRVVLRSDCPRWSASLGS